MILAILNLHVAPMPSTKFGLNLTYGTGADVVSRLSRWPHRWPSAILDSQTERLSNSESLCRSDASHQVSAQSNTVWKEMLFEEFQDGHRIFERINFSNFESLAPIKFWHNPTYGLGGDVI